MIKLNKSKSKIKKYIGLTIQAIGVACIAMYGYTYFNNAHAQASSSITQQNIRDILTANTKPENHPSTIINFYLHNSVVDKSFFNLLLEEFKKEQLTIKTTNLNYSKAVNSINIIETDNLGLADMYLVPLYKFEKNSINDPVTIFSYPHMFNDWENVRNSYYRTTTELFKLMNKNNSFNSLYTPLSIIPSSYNIIASNKEVTDFKNNTISFHKDNFSSINTFASITPKENIKFYSDNIAPSTTLINTNLTYYYDNKLYQSYPYIYFTNHSINSYALVVNTNWWARLTNEQKKVILNITEKTSQFYLTESISIYNSIINSLRSSPQIKFLPIPNNFRQEIMTIHNTIPKNIAEQLYIATENINLNNILINNMLNHKK